MTSSPATESALREALEREERSHGETIDQRDALESFVATLYHEITGEECRWSNRFGLADVREGILDCIAAGIREAMSRPPVASPAGRGDPWALLQQSRIEATALFLVLREMRTRDDRNGSLPPWYREQIDKTLASPPTSAWLPIDEAAKTGVILGWHAGYREVAVLRWARDDRRFAYLSETGHASLRAPFEQPTLYQPLPLPPGEEK